MNYKKIYDQLIEKRQTVILSNRNGTHLHHIKPKSIYPELINDPNNIIRLTVREHFFAHRLLEKITCEQYGQTSKEHQSMAYALSMFCKGHKRIISSRTYAYIMQQVSICHSIRMTAKWKDPKFRQLIVSSKIGKNNPMYGKNSEDFMTAAAKEQKHKKCSIAMIGRKTMIDPLGKTHKIKQEDIQYYYDLGYRFGMSSNAKNRRKAKDHPNFGNKTMYNPVLDIEVHVKPDQIQTYIKNGYRLGKRPRLKLPKI